MYILYIQWNCAPEYFNILWHLTKMYGPKVFLLTKIKAYFNVLYNQTHFPSSLVCRIRQVPELQISAYLRFLRYENE